MTNKHLESSIRGDIDARDVQIGHGVVVEDGVVITGKGGPADRVVLGDFCFIGRDTRIVVPEFRLGDYSKLNAYAFAHGGQRLQIGRNCWFGGNVVLDSVGGLDIDDNVGVGAHDQLWTHIQFGDIVEGSRFHSHRYMHVGRDAWFVGHCIVSPVKVGERSMAMVGSVITRDMEPNHIYAGVPAKDLSDKMGYQFEERTIEQKAAKLSELITAFEEQHPEYRGQLHVVHDLGEIGAEGTYFDISRRTYTKRYLEAEIAFLKAHVPLVKFFPDGEPDFITLQNQNGADSREGNRVNFLYIAGCLVFTVLGQLLVKKGALELRGAASLATYVLNPWVVSGFASAGIAAISWLKALQHYRLNYAYPFMSLSFLAVAVLSALVFGEESRPQQWVGLSIVLLGLYIGSR